MSQALVTNLARLSKHQLFTDDFNRANGNLAAPHWEQIAAYYGNMSISTNVISANAGGAPGSSAAARVISPKFSRDQYASVTVSDLTYQSVNYQAGPIVRATHDGNVDRLLRDYYFAAVLSNNDGGPYPIRFGKVINGSTTLFSASSGGMVVSGDRLGIFAVGNTIAVTLNDKLLGGDFIVSDKDITRAGAPGVAAGGSSTTPTADDFRCGNITVKPRFALADVPTDVRFGVTKKVRTKQPPAGTPIDFTNPLTKGLRFFGSMHTGFPVEYVRREQGIPQSAYRVPRPAPDGPLCWYGLEADDTSHSVLFPKHDDMVVGKSELTAMVFAKHSSNAIAQNQTPFGYAGTGDDPFYIRTSTTGADFTFRVWTTGPVNTQSSCPIGANGIDWEDWNTLGGTYADNTVTGRANYFKDPTPATIPSGDGLTIGDAGQSNNVPRFGFGFNGGTGGWDGWLAYAALWDRELSDVEWNSMVDNPWQIFEPQRIHTPINEALPELAIVEKPW